MVIQQTLKNDYVFLFLVPCLMLSRFWQFIEATEPWVSVFAMMYSLGYALSFLPPVVLSSKLLIAPLHPTKDGPARGKQLAIYANAWCVALIMLLVTTVLQLCRHREITSTVSLPTS